MDASSIITLLSRISNIVVSLLSRIKRCACPCGEVKIEIDDKQISV